MSSGRWNRRREAMRAVINEAIEMLNEDQDQDEDANTEPRTRIFINRDRVGAHERLMHDYFSDNPVYTDEMFRRRFRMSKRLFQRIRTDLEAHYEYFQQVVDGRGKQGHSPFQKCTAALRQLAYGVASDMMDEYIQMGEKTARDCLNNFCTGIIQLYGKHYLRRPTFDDIQRLYYAHENAHGFVGMLGSIDCTHWDWQNCPVAWQGQYTRGDHGRPSLILQAVASQDLWFWHAFFGVAGSNNDINVLNHSPILNDAAEGRTPSIPFSVNGAMYRHGYYLADGIYPDWSIFVKSFTCPMDDKRVKFKAAQESARKDVERAFGVLKQRWHILHIPARASTAAKLRNIMYACIILHNMILEDEGRAISTLPFGTNLPDEEEVEITEEERSLNVSVIRNGEIHENLRSDLVEHLWRIDLPHGNAN